MSLTCMMRGKAPSYFAKQALLVKSRLTASLKGLQMMKKKFTRMVLSVTLNLQVKTIRHSKLPATAGVSARCYSSISIKIINGQMLVMFRLLALYMTTMPFSFSMSVTSTRSSWLTSVKYNVIGLQILSSHVTRWLSLFLSSTSVGCLVQSR